jgi:antitoxin component of MazEF toxin-antitoxin module
MRKKLSAIGNSLGLVIEKPILELLNIDRDTELNIRTDGERLIVEPIREPQRTSDRRTRVRDATEKLLKKHASTMRKLAK